MNQWFIVLLLNLLILSGSAPQVNGECGELILHLSFSEEARDRGIFGTCEEPVTVTIENTGIPWTYGENNSDKYSERVQITYDKHTGYLLKKKLPYGNYTISDFYYEGDGSPVTESDVLQYMSPPVIMFELSEEEPEIPVFMEIKNTKMVSHGKAYGEEAEKERELTAYFRGQEAERQKCNSRKMGYDSRGEVQLHAEPENLGNKYYVTAELQDSGGHEVSHICCFGGADDSVYNVKLAPDLYRIIHVFYIDPEGNILAEKKDGISSPFLVLPHRKAVKINFSLNKYQEVISEIQETETSEETIAVSDEEPSAATGMPSDSKDDIRRRTRIILYYLIAVTVLTVFAGGGVYLLKRK